MPSPGRVSGVATQQERSCLRLPSRLLQWVTCCRLRCSRGQLQLNRGILKMARDSYAKREPESLEAAASSTPAIPRYEVSSAGTFTFPCTPLGRLHDVAFLGRFGQCSVLHRRWRTALFGGAVTSPVRQTDTMSTELKNLKGVMPRHGRHGTTPLRKVTWSPQPRRPCKPQ